MNHIYRLVWSQVHRTWLVVSELARGRGKAGRTSTPSRARSVWWAALPLSLPMLALAAAPAGITAIDAARPAAAIVTARAALAPTVIAPVVSSAHPTGGQVTAGSGRIDYGDHLTTIQQHSQNLSLNWLSFNIGAQDTVNFLQPNAQAIAVNRIADPNGSVILGRLNANGQVFLINPNGVLFGKGAQVNVGGLVASTLDVSDSELGRGALHLGGTGRGSVTNRGTLTAAPGGYVALLGHTVSNQGAIHAPAGSVALAGGSAVTLSFDGNHLLDMQIDASTMNALAENKQLIVADGGQVLMSAGAKDSLLASVVNNSGTIQARTVENRAGKIVLLGGMAAGNTRVDGTLDASAPDDGDGGFIETSAAQVQVADATKITTLAAAGNAGTWLIDPTDFTIAVSGGDMTGATLSSQLGGGNVTIQSTDGSAGTQGNINVNDTVSWNANTLTLNALNNINVNAAMNASGTAGLALAYGQANPAAGNTSTYNVNAPINLADTGSFSTTLGNDGAAIDYTIITGLGDPSNLGAADLLMMGNSGYYVLGADIDASATAGWSGGFAPVLGFTGTFDGLGHTITGLTINRPGQSQVGLFGLTQAGSIVRNVGMVGGAITGNGLVGNLVGDNHATISHVYATGTVTDVSAPNSLGAAGGLVGSNSGTITDAYATGAVTSGGYAVGGLVGFNLGTITNAYATGATSSGTSGASGGGLVGVSAGTITHGYWDTDTASQAATAGVTGLTTQQLIASLPAGFDPAIWGNGDNQTTPYMLGWAGNQVFTRNDLPDATGARLYTVVLGLDHLQAMQANLGGRYVLGNAIDASDTSGLNGGTGFVPLGTDGAGNVLNGGDGFTGTFDGLGYAISGLSIDRTNRVGLFGYAGNGSILRNVRLLGGAMTGSDYVGGLVGQEVGGTITSSYATNVVTGNDFVGGLVGSSSGTITDAYATGAVTGKIHVGGLVGENDGGTIDNAYATNVVTGSSIVGGLVGSSSNGTITDAYATGAVTGNESFHGGYVGGLVGQGDGDTITNVHATGVVIGYDNYVGGLIGGNTGTITNAYATGSVTGSVGDVGGLIGNNAGTITNTHATGTVKGYGYVGGLIGNNTGAITNAHAIGAATGYGSYVGGLIGDNTGAITSAYATGAATAGYYYVGGLIGSNTGAVASVYATGAATGGTNPTSSFAGATDYVGGLIGSNAGMVNNAYATGAATAADDYVGGLMGSNDGVVTNVYATGAVTGKSHVGGLVGFNDGGTGGTVGNSYWDTTTTVQTEGCGGTSCGSGASGYTTTQMMQLASFASWGANIDAQGGTGSVWRIYEGHTAPLLRSFLTPHTASAQPDFDGSGAALTNIASVTVPTDPKIFGSFTGGDTLTLAGLTAGGGYTATSNADLSGLYSTQQGYDLIGSASRTISTPGSAAGEVRLDNGASWNSGTLAIATAGNINIMGALSGDALRLNSGGAITDTHALNVASFVLGGGNWNQIGATLPTFSATDFTLAGGSFVRALGGDGSSATPYQLADVYGLQGVGTLLGDSFTLSNNIDASNATGWNGGAGFAPIGTDSTTQFTGTFDGLGHNISDLAINRPTQDNVGLFGFVGNGTLRNIGLVGGSVSGADYVGELVGQVSSGNISNAYATGTVSGNNYIGGLVGYFSGTGSLSQSYATGNVSGVAAGSSYIGGLAGYLDGGIYNLLNISDVYATGNVSAGVSGSYVIDNYIGGLVGYSAANINNAYATGDINLGSKSGYYIGGLAGYNGSIFKNVHATGNINLSYIGQYVGGLVGSNNNFHGYGLISNAYATGNINAGIGSSGGATYVGGLVGQNTAYIENSYATGNLATDPDGGFGWAGGLVGRNGDGSKQGFISNVYATGNVDGGAISMYQGGLVGQNISIPLPSYISNAYSTGHVSALGDYSGGSVGGNNGVLQSVYWNTETSGQSSAGLNSATGPNATGLTSAQMMQAGSFGGFNGTPFYGSCIVCGSGISATGGTGAVWRIYEGHTTPLLSGFLTPHTINAQPDFDGSGAALTNIASVTVPTDPKIFGSVTGGDTLTLAGLTAGGGYTASSNADLSGLYSTQQGYDLIGSASRTISTPGSAAGEVRLDNGASWNSGTLAIATAGNINIAGVLKGDALHLNGGGTITDTAALNVTSFVLGGGNWQQLGATLPAFSATDFSLAGGSFVRALGGDGTSGNPYQLTDVYGLQGAGTLLGDSFTLSNDIDASGTTGWNGGGGFAPIGNSTTQFTGIFDGLGHTISDLTINRPTQDNVGLFGSVGGTVLRNIGLVGGSVSGADYVGGLVGHRGGSGSISNAYATGNVSGNNSVGGLVGALGGGSLSQSYATGNVNGVTATSSYIGGLAGYLDGGSNISSLLNVNDVYATGNVSAGVSGSSAAGGYIGGLAGFSSANISNAYATGNISISGYGMRSYIGGLVGYSGSTLENVHATGNINLITGQYVGGLAGINAFPYGRITYAYATGNITVGTVDDFGGANYVGGLVGQNSNILDKVYATGNLEAPGESMLMYAGGLVGRNGESVKPGTISNAYATGNVDSGAGDYLGGLVGQNYGPPGNNYIANAYSAGRVIGSGYNVGGVVGFNGGALQNVYWNTETAGQSIPGNHATLGVIGLTSAQMLQVGSFGGLNTYAFFCVTCGAGISATGSTGAVWRIYEGHTMPLLSGFLTPHTINAQPDFDGSGAALTNIASVTVPTDPKIFGSFTGGDTLTLAGLTAGGGYTATSNADLSGLYSTQQGYDLIGSASRTISTPGSAAGEVRLDNGASWNSGTLAIATAGNINIMGALSGDALRLNSGGAITDTHALNVASFVLGGGNWNQIGATLPTFGATDFTLAGGSFVRALGGDGSSATPYQLADVYGLQGVGTLLGDSFTLSNNIDASAATGWNAGAAFAPIGDSTTQFTGTFDGLGHTISDLTINRPTQDNVGLFGYTSTGSTISNVGLLSGSTTGRSEVGSLAGYNDGTINQAYATGAVSSSSYSGGLVGYNTGTINLAYATGAVNSSSYSGGLVGYNKGTISQAYATGTVSGAAGSGNSPLGGLVGANVLGAISQAYATGAVNGGTANRVGGLVGWNDRGMIDQAYATGAVNGGNYVGGLVGFGSGSISRTYATGTVSGVDYVGGLVGLGQTGSISQAYATGAVSGRNYLGGLVGSGGSSIIGSYWDMETTGQTYGCSCYGDVTGLTTAQMMDPARFTYWGIATAGGSTSAWRTYAGHTAPLLRAFMTPLALGSDNVSLVYNGSDQTSSNYTYGTLTPGFWLPSASVDASLILGSAGASLGARNVGNHALDLSPYSGQMGYDIDYTAGTLTITPATLTLSAVGDSKAYNGTTDSAGMVTFGGLLAGDSLAGLTQSFASKNVLGTNASTLGVDAGYVLDDGNGGGNYIIATHTAAGTIAPYVVDLGGSRVYDGSAAVDAGDLVLGTLVGNETLTLSGTGSMADKNVGNGKSFTLGTLTLSDGTGDAANYILAGGNDTVDISKRAIVVDATGADKVYDGTTADAVKLASTSLLVGDTVNFSGTGAFADKNVGVAKAVGVSGIAATGADANNYSYNTTANTSADITALGVTVDATGINRVYDGTTADAVALASAGVLSGDTVNFIGTGSFADKSVGTGKTVSVSGIAAGGSDANNYSYNTTAATTADITAKTITINATGVDKVYDGSTAATIAALGATGLVAGDVVTFDNASAAFDDKNAGTGKTVTVHGIAAAGTDAGNYSFNPTANTTADISQLGITVGATGTNKVYDGTTADAVALASDGVLSGDSVAFTGTGRFADKNVGSAKAVGVSGIAASGRDAGNYRYNTAATTTADVTPATLTYRADAALFQTGQMPGGLSGAVTGLVGGESLGEATDGTLTWTTPADSASPAGLYAIDGGGLSALNYLFEQAPENATALQVAPGSASRVVTTVVAGLQQDEASPDDDTSAPYAPSVHIVDGGVRLP